MNHDRFLQGKTAVVTGGGRGIGKAMAIRLARLGADTVRAGTKQPYLEQTVAEIAAFGGAARFILCDVARESDVLALFRFAGQVDILINNAGIGRFSPIVSTSVEDWDTVLNINLRGVFLCAREAMKSMAGRGGRIINIASVVGIKGYPNQAAYTASKHGIMGLSKVMAVEGQKDDIITQVIAPGGVATDMIGDARPDMGTSTMMQPEDMADTMEFLLRQTGNAITDLVRMRRRSNAPW